MSLPRWGVERPVPVNLLMIAILLAGGVAAATLRLEFFPEQESEQILVSLPYPGATPEEIEDTLAIKVEDQLIGLDEVDELSTTLSEGGGGITVELVEGTDPNEAEDTIEREIDALLDLPDESETITTEQLEPRLPAIRLAIFGDADESVLKKAIKGVRDDLRSLPGMGEIVIDGVRDYEVRIDIDQARLVEQGVPITAVANAVRDWMREVPGGTVQGSTGNIRVRTMGVPERQGDIEAIAIKARPDGSIIRLRDLAVVTEGFIDSPVVSRFNGQPSAELTVYKVNEQDVVKIAQMVRAYVAARQGEPFAQSFRDRLRGGAAQRAYEVGRDSTHPLPTGTNISTNSDLARFVEGRLNLLSENAGIGLILVFAVLLVFLNWRAAMWVGVGLTTALAGALVFMSLLGVTLNLLTMFGLIVVIGLLVDDAIVVAENIQARHEQGEPALTAAVHGAEQVFWPVCATVATSIVAFLPLTFIKGNIGDLLGALPIVVACALTMSLIESLFILPSHMKHSLVGADKHREKQLHKTSGKKAGWLTRYETWREEKIAKTIVPGFGQALAWLLRHRYETVCVALAVLIVSLGMVAGGRVQFRFLGNNDAETIVVDLKMPVGTPAERTAVAVDLVEDAIRTQEGVLNLGTTIGQSANVDTGQTSAATSHIAQMFIELLPVEQRDIESRTVIEQINTRLGGTPDGVERLSFTEISGGPGGPDITYKVTGDNVDRLDDAVADLKRQLATFAGVYDIADNNNKGQLEIRYTLRPDAQALGLSAGDVASQLRGYLFGIDAHVFADRQEDIDVRVRLSEDDRRSLTKLTNSWIIMPDGGSVPLAEIAEITPATTYASINRIDRKRAVTVTAYVAPGVSPESVTGSLDLDRIRADYPDLAIDPGGRQEQLGDAFASLPLGFAAAVIMIYMILTVLFNSFFQPIIVMLVIPFAIIGVVWGHLFLGYDITFLSLIGFVALSGIVVNDSLILVQFYNIRRAAGDDVFDALVAAGQARLRAIFLTTVTTVFGLLPLMLEQSFQAKFLVPMAIAIAMGLISATVMILVVLPCFMMIFDDVKRLIYWLWHGSPRPTHPPAEAHMAGHLSG